MPPPPGPISRRRFLTRSAAVAGAGAIAPFTFIRSAAGRTTDLGQYVREQRRRIGAPAISAAVVKGDEIIWSIGVGWADEEQGIPATPDTVYQLASVSKTVTCAGIMTLVEDGLLDLDADVNDYLPFEVRIPTAPHAPITMRQLLTHTSSLRDRYNVWGTPYSDPTLYFHGDSPLSLGEFMQSYFAVGGSRYQAGANFYDRKPGTAYSYSNLAVALSGYVAEVVSGKDFDQLCKQRILHPLGMENSGYRLADISTTNLAMPYHLNKKTGATHPFFQYGYPDYPDGALRTSAVHLAHWLGAFIQYGEFRGARVLERSTVHEIRSRQVPYLSWRQGLIWYGNVVHGAFHWGHTGGDYGESTRMFFHPDSGVGVITLANTYLGDSLWYAFRDIEFRLFDAFS